MPFVTVKPSEFVQELIDPGLEIAGAGRVPLTRYMSAVVEFGGNKECEEVLVPLQSMKDGQGVKLINQTRNFGRLMTGQGYPSDFKLVMAFLVQHMAEVKRLKTSTWVKEKSAPGAASKLVAKGSMSAFDRYFKGDESPNAVLRKMVAGGVFGMDCIGFVSQYLVRAGVWNEYKPYYPGDYVREFKPVARIDDVKRLNLLIWDNYHIAIIDRIHTSFLDNGKKVLRVDVCQSSNSERTHGPQTNRRVELQETVGAYKGYRLFKISNVGSPGMPVTNDCYIASMKDLTWLGESWMAED
jgi:hypothetical protein